MLKSWKLSAPCACRVVSCAYVYFVESKRQPGEQKKLDKVFTDVQSDKIDQVTIKSEKGDTTTARKQGTAWQLATPVSAPSLFVVSRERAKLDYETGCEVRSRSRA